MNSKRSVLMPVLNRQNGKRQNTGCVFGAGSSRKRNSAVPAQSLKEIIVSVFARLFDSCGWSVFPLFAPLGIGPWGVSLFITYDFLLDNINPL
jgi:hypothetical protein